MRASIELGLVLIALAVLPAPLRASASEDLPIHRAADPAAPAVTEENLLESERFWPYQVALVEPWAPPGRGQPIAADFTGVLIRVEDSGLARIDFGRDGLYEVPVGETDLLERANRIRTGELEKMLPNYVLVVGPRLLDSGAPALRAFGATATYQQRGFLSVFADPGGEDFAELAASLAPLHGRHGVLTVLFPQGSSSDAAVRERLRSVDWTVPFVYDHLSEPYTDSTLGEGTPLPALLLQTVEGRVLYRSPWRGEVVAELAAALDEAFGPRVSSEVSR